MMRSLSFIALLLTLLPLLSALTACNSGKELPMVKDEDPTWSLAQDHATAADISR